MPVPKWTRYVREAVETSIWRLRFIRAPVYRWVVRIKQTLTVLGAGVELEWMTSRTVL